MWFFQPSLRLPASFTGSPKNVIFSPSALHQGKIRSFVKFQSPKVIIWVDFCRGILGPTLWACTITSPLLLAWQWALVQFYFSSPEVGSGPPSPWSPSPSVSEEEKNCQKCQKYCVERQKEYFGLGGPRVDLILDPWRGGRFGPPPTPSLTLCTRKKTWIPIWMELGFHFWEETLWAGMGRKISAARERQNAGQISAIRLFGGGVPPTPPPGPERGAV